MKLLVVDDEKHVRDAIQLLIDRDLHGVTDVLEATDGAGAIELMQRDRPEIVLTDMMMPGMNGVKLLEWLHANAPSCKTIVVSGHDDFALVRHAIQYGGTDYILKPIDPAQLNAAVGKAAAAWRREEAERAQERQRQIEMNELRPVFWDEQLSALLRDSSRFRAVSVRLEREFGLPGAVSSARIVSIRLDTMEKKLKDRFGTSQDLLVFSLVNICNEYLSRSRCGVAFRLWGGSEIVLLLWQRLERCQALLEDINDGMARTLHTRLHYGIGGIHSCPAELARSHQEAQTALLKRNLLQKEKWLHTPLPPGTPQQRPLVFADFEADVQLAVRSGSPEHIQASLRSWFEALGRLERLTLEQLDVWRREAAIMRSRWLAEWMPQGETRSLSQDGGEAVLALDERGLFSVAQWQRDFARPFIELGGSLLQTQQKEKNSIRDIAKYIEAHYREELSLQDIAARFYLSREYISRKFKQEFGINLSEYLTDIRMEKAKLLLLNPNLRICDVADAVGYQDEKYFSKVFKKTSGCSPAEYRKEEAT
jgi:two-component system response regulator YesN